MNDLIHSVTSNATLLVALALASYWLVKRGVEAYRGAKAFVSGIVDERIPAAVHAALDVKLKNGVRDMVKEVVHSAISKHEDYEAQRERATLGQLEARLQGHESRLDALERRRRR